MAAQSANIVDLKAYREARSRTASSPSGAPSPAETSPAAVFPNGQMFSNGAQPMMIWVPVWTFFPVMAGPWVHAR